jgi:hypothetical protein
MRLWDGIVVAAFLSQHVARLFSWFIIGWYEPSCEIQDDLLWFKVIESG